MNLKNIIFVFFLFFLTNYIFCQVGIGTSNPNQSSILDLYSDNKGLLITRIPLQSITDNTTIAGGNVESLLVYNTTTNSELKKGFYYWSGTKWEYILNETVGDWNLQGNSGTNPNTNFIGTTDNQPVWVRTNNVNRVRFGLDESGSFTNMHVGFNPRTAYSGTITSMSSNTDMQSGGQAVNIFGIENQMYLRSGSTITGTFRAQRNRLWNLNTANYPNVVGVLNEYRGEGTDISRFDGFQNNLDFRAGSNTTDFFGFSNNFNGQVNGTVTNYYGFYSGVHSSLGGVTNYYGFYQPNLGTAANKFAFLYKGNGSTTKDVSITGLGRIGIGTETPNSDIQILGSVSKKYDTTGSNTGVFNITDNHHTIRLSNSISSINLPNPTTCLGRIYVIIGSNGISSKNITVTGGAIVHDDVTNATINSINTNQRFQIQSDGTNWIVIGN